MEITSTILSAIVRTPSKLWRNGHNYHHAHSNNLDYFQTSQTAPLDSMTYNKLTSGQKNII